MSILDVIAEAGIKLAYNGFQLLPNGMLSFIGKKLPAWPDIFTPGGFIIPRPFIPPAVDLVAPEWPLGKVRAPLHLLLLRDCVEITGQVAYVEVRPPDAEWDHETFAIWPDDQRIMNHFNAMSGLKQIIECEPPVGAALPAEGDRVRVYGSFVICLPNGWTEVHPTFKWERLSS